MIFPTIMFWVALLVPTTVWVSDTAGNAWNRDSSTGLVYTVNAGDLIVICVNGVGRAVVEGCILRPSSMGILVGPCLPIPKELQ